MYLCIYVTFSILAHTLAKELVVFVIEKFHQHARNVTIQDQFDDTTEWSLWERLRLLSPTVKKLSPFPKAYLRQKVNYLYSISLKTQNGLLSVLIENPELHAWK